MHDISGYKLLTITLLNLLPTVSHFSGSCKYVYLATVRNEVARNGTKFIWFERARRV